MLDEAGSNVTVLSKERVTRRALYLFLGCLICFLALVSQQPAHAAQPSPTGPGIVIDSDTKFAALPEGQRLQLLIQMIRSGRHRLADRLLNTYPFKGKHAVNRTLFIEGMILTAISGLAGMALGAAIVWGFFRNGLDFSAIWDMEMEAAGVVIDPVIVPRFHWNQILQSLAFILVIGSLASIYPAWRATRIDVAEAMKFEE